jgi:hypothetical protein
LVERIAAKEDPDPVRDYVTLLCAIQLLNVLSADEPDFYRSEKPRFGLIAEVQQVLERRRSQFAFADEAERAKFFAWFDRWFVRRAEPAAVETPA